MRSHRLFAAVYAAALTAFTGWLALDTFVIPSVYQTDAGELNLSLFTEESAAERSTAEAEESAAESSSTGGTSGRRGQHSRSGKQPSADSGASVPESSASEETGTAAEPVSTADSYRDENISITVTTCEAYDTTIYTADVRLSSAQYLKSAFADDSYGRHITAATSEIAAAHNAVLAINGDYYGAQQTGYVIRNGIVYRDSSDGEDLLCIYADGSMQIVNSDTYTAQELAAQGVWQAYSFGPALIENGAVSVTEYDEVGKAMASNPRTAIGMIDELHYVFVVADGRTAESAGLSLSELATFMQSLGVKTAYNLDGGGSSTMYFQGQVINNPTSNGKTIREREVSDIVYIG